VSCHDIAHPRKDETSSACMYITRYSGMLRLVIGPVTIWPYCEPFESTRWFMIWPWCLCASVSPSESRAQSSQLKQMDDGPRQHSSFWFRVTSESMTIALFFPEFSAIWNGTTSSTTVGSLIATGLSLSTKEWLCLFSLLFTPPLSLLPFNHLLRSLTSQNTIILCI
jgi:hypothetical protein